MRAEGRSPSSGTAAARAGGDGRGFTLIEVLVALAIVAVTLATGIKAAGALTGNAERLAEVSAAQWCADNQLTGLRLAREFPGSGSFDFACEQLGVAYLGTLVVKPTDNPDFRSVDAQVRNAAGQLLFRLLTALPRNY